MSAAVDWPQVRRILVVKLRSIGDTVLATPSLIALQRYLPSVEIDILLEDWVAPVLDGFEGVNVISMGDGIAARLRTARRLRNRSYDVAFNLHGGTTSTFLTWASGAKHRFGNDDYQYSFLYNHLLPIPYIIELWGRDKVHSAEQQLSLIGFAGIPVDDPPKTRLAVTEKGTTPRVREWLDRGNFALLHPGTAFETKQWSAENFARLGEHLANEGLDVIAIAAKAESRTLDELRRASNSTITTYNDLTLPEITALASGASIFVGNDSGIAHIAAAVETPAVVIFGSSNRVHWRPWTDAPNEIVFNPFDCQPCPGYTCEAFGDSRCIRSVTVEQVLAAVERVSSTAIP
ncbi:MAG: glycosyltransferase family 9 protein [Pyrinomonadaceae bacterium]